MALTKYSYDIATSFSYGVNVGTLHQEILDSQITIALDSITADSTTVNIYFKDVLPAADETILNNIIAAHDGRVSPPDEMNVNINRGNVLQINKKKAYGANYRIYTHNFTDKTTWYQYATQVVGEQLTTSDYTTYQAAHTYIINLEQNDMITREHWMLMPDGSFTNRWTYKPKVYVNDVEQTDGYTIDFVNGTVTFSAPLSSTDVVKMDYYYATVSTFAVVPPEGKKLRIYKATMVSSDIPSFDGHVIQLDIFAGNPSYSYPIGDATSPYNQFAFRYRSLLDFIVAGDKCTKISIAAYTDPLVKIEFDYDAVIELRSDQYAGLYLSMSEDTPINTAIGIGTFQIEFMDLGEDY